MSSVAEKQAPRAGACPERRVRCELDDWSFDPRYTDGICPICGWRPDAAVYSVPAWRVALGKVEWDLVGLFVLFAVLVFWGVVVAHAAGFGLPSLKP